MDIKTIDINFYDKSELFLEKSKLENNLIVHKKSLPYLSIVQSVEGSYGICIDSSKQFNTGRMGVFIAPPHKLQIITHYPDEHTQIMRAH